MALTKETVTDLISITEYGNFEIRKSTRVLEDGKIIGQEYHREVLNPGDDISTKEEKIKSLGALLWTAEVITKWKEKTKPKVN